MPRLFKEYFCLAVLIWSVFSDSNVNKLGLYERAKFEMFGGLWVLVKMNVVRLYIAHTVFMASVPEIVCMPF